MYSMFSNSNKFNQDLSLWNVSNVTICSYFSENTPQWTLPKPNFTNCNPN
jgi:surface protein